MLFDGDTSRSTTTGTSSRSRRSFSTLLPGNVAGSNVDGLEDTENVIPPKGKSALSEAIAQAVNDVAVGNTKLDLVCDPDTFMTVVDLLESHHHSHKKMQYDAETGEVFVREVPSAPREHLNRWIQNHCPIYNAMLTGNCNAPMRSSGSTTFAFGPKILQPDSSFFNSRVPHHLVERDSNGRRLPSTLLEIAYSESWVDLMSIVNHYLQWQCVRMVITIRLIGGVDVDVPRYFVCTVHMKNDRDEINVRVINFGPAPLDPFVVGAIEEHVGVSRANFAGVGYGYMGMFPYPPTEILPADPDGELTVEIPAEVLWHNVSLANIIPSWRMDLRQLFNNLREDGFWDESMAL